MNRQKWIAGLTAMLCSAGVLSCFPAISGTVSATELVNNDFEVNYGGWYGNTDTVVLKAVEGIGYHSSRGMSVSGRSSASDGASAEKGFYLSGDEKYTYSVWVYSTEAEQFHFSLSCADLETTQEFETELASRKSKAGTWTKLSASYRAPKNSGEFRLTITTDSTNDFVFDDVIITGKNDMHTVSAASTEKGLKDEFANYFRVGNILNGSTVKNSTITASVLKDYNSIECENEMKPDATLVQSQCNGTNIGVSLKNAASIMDFCVNNKIAMRGHTLVWHSQTPLWFFKENFNANGNCVSATVMDQRMESYIKNMFDAIKTQYPDLNLYAYDVANECISDDSNRTANNGGTREPGENVSGQSPWVQVYGSNSFVEHAFTYARKYAPEGCALYYNDYNEFFLQCTGNTNQRGWGQAGANGADCHFTGISQDMQGDVIWDSISDLDFYLTEGSSLTGAVVDDETYAGEGGDGYCNVYVSADSTWTVTGDSTVSSLENEGTIVDSEGKTVTIQGTDGTVYVEGNSEYTITTGSYSDSADLSGVTAIQDQSAYAVEKPEQL